MADMQIDLLEPFIGKWSMEARFPNAEPGGVVGETTFAWLSGGPLLIQRAEVPVPEAPDLVAVIAPGRDGAPFLQHHFDSRGVVRLYEMSVTGGIWKLSRTEADFSPLEFSQRFTGTFGDGGDTIAGRWEKSFDGVIWELDFELFYARIR